MNPNADDIWEGAALVLDAVTADQLLINDAASRPTAISVSHLESNKSHTDGSGYVNPSGNSIDKEGNNAAD